MRFAQKDGVRILPNPLEKEAVCPLCKCSVIAKCGEIKTWHWAHKASEDCDSFSEGETDWHLEWKNEFSPEFQEVTVEKDIRKHPMDSFKTWTKHRADIKINDIVVEFQNSPISQEDIEKREKFYEKMKWVINAKEINLVLREKEGFISFRWKWPRKSWVDATQPIYFDLGITPLGDGRLTHKLLLVKKIHWSNYVGGWGKLISKENFIKECEYGYYRN